MSATLEKLIEKINDIEFLSIDREKDVALWQMIYKQKTTWMLEYYRERYGNAVSQQIGLEIAVGVKNAMKGFTTDTGVPFFFYVKKIIDNERNKRLIKENDAGIHLSDKTLRLIKDIKKAITQLNNESGIELIDKNRITNGDAVLIAKELNIPVSKILDALKAEKQMRTQNATVIDEDGEQTSVIENISDEALNVEEEKIREIRLREYFECMERVYKGQREKTKEKLSMLIVSDILLHMDEFGDGEIGRWIRKLECINDRLLLACKHRHVGSITHKKIAEYFQTSEPNITQIWERFKEKVQEEIRKIQKED